MDNRLRSLLLAMFVTSTLTALGCEEGAKSPDGLGGLCKASGGNACPVPMQKIGNACACKLFDIHGQPLPDAIGTVEFQ